MIHRKASHAAIAAISFSLLAWGSAHRSLVAAESSASNLPAIPEVIVNNCAMCHGPNLEGAMGPAIVPLRAELAKDGKALRKIIEEGSMERGMPPSANLSADDITLITTYLLGASKKP